MSTPVTPHPDQSTPPAPHATPREPDGILAALVYCDGASRFVYLSHDGAHGDLNLDEMIQVGGDWEEANVIHEDAPPRPPNERGFWRLEWPWRNAKHGATLPEDERDDDLLCCVYLGRPKWEKMLLIGATPPSETSDAPAALRERILDIALRNRDACGYNCDCHDEIAALFASLPAPPRTQP